MRASRADRIRLLFVGGLSALGALPLLFSNGVPGFDAPSHVTKTSFLMYSFAHGNFLGWSEFWYSGFQMLYTYSPLTYLLAGMLGWPFGSAMLGMKVLIVLTFILSGLTLFALARDFGVPPNWSVVAAVLYSITSPHILIMFYMGSLTYGLAFAVAPLLFLSGRVALRKQSVGSTIAFGAVIALLMVSNETTAYVLFFPLLAYFLISVPKSKAFRSAIVVAASAFVGLVLAAFWLAPYLATQLSGEVNLLAESATGAYPNASVIHWYTFFAPNFGNASAGDVGWILLVPAFASIAFLRTREEFALYGAAIVVMLMTIGPTLTPLFYHIPLVLALQFAWRFVIADILFAAPLAALFFSRFFRWLSVGKVPLPQIDRKAIAFLFVLLLVATPLALLSTSKVHSDLFQTRQLPSDPGQQEALSFLASQPGFFRVMAIDRYYESFAQYTLKGSIDGWYDQATTQAYRNFTYNIYYCGANTRTLEGLRLLGARYVIIDRGYGGDATSAIQAYNSSTSPFGPPVFENGEVSIYEVPDSQLVYVTGSMPNTNFALSQDVDCKVPIPSAPTSRVNFTVSNLSWGETRISFDVQVNQSSYVLVSNSYSTGWAVKDNGSSTPLMLSPPGLPIIHVSRGFHQIVLQYSPTPLEQEASLSSLVAVVGMSAVLLERKLFHGDSASAPDCGAFATA